ncbi:MAG TPA: EAL domain-containing protein [Egibacteraceae bacterium]|nr:EAL domain-containing protein [Egibacteraceae bacterium]
MMSPERLSWRVRALMGLVVAAMIVAAAAWVHATGGTQHPWTHLLYVPVLLAAWAFGPLGGAIAGVAAGLAVGPGMPVDVDAGVAQTTTNWIYRSGFFCSIGAVSGGLHQRMRAQLVQTRAERRRFSSLVEHAPDVVLTCDARGVVGYAGPSVTRVLGYPVESVVSRPLADLVHTDDAAALERMTQAPMAERGSPVELRVRHADGSWRHLEMVVNDLLDDRDVAAVVCNGRDVTEWRAIESELRHQVWHDLATGLPNRIRFTQALQEAVTSAGAEDDGAAAMLLVHVDRFGSVQEGFGPDIGELLITAVGQRLSARMGPGELLARFATTEFAVLCPDVHEHDAARRIAERLLEAVEEPFLVAHGEVRLSVSIGVALASDTDRDAGQLIRDVHAAVHHAKRTSAKIATFEVAWRRQAASAMDTETALHSALERGQLALCYQPIVDLASGRAVGVEALIRWHHPRLGTVAPSDFIPVAEQAGMIGAIGRWVIDNACVQLARWRDELGRTDLTVAVNVSARQLDSPQLLHDVRRALDVTGIPSGALILELTETALLGDISQTIHGLDAIKALGVRLAVDDFGTGYSSLGYLKLLPVDILKIDRLFVSQLGQAGGDDVIVSAIIGLARSLGLATIGEGVEGSAQRDRLIQLGCDRAQGYHYARPEPAEALTPMLAAAALPAPVPVGAAGNGGATADRDRARRRG